jgi:hypothetical protein
MHETKEEGLLSLMVDRERERLLRDDTLNDYPTLPYAHTYTYLSLYFASLKQNHPRKRFENLTETTPHHTHINQYIHILLPTEIMENDFTLKQDV